MQPLARSSFLGGILRALLPWLLLSGLPLPRAMCDALQVHAGPIADRLQCFSAVALGAASPTSPLSVGLGPLLCLGWLSLTSLFSCTKQFLPFYLYETKSVVAQKRQI